MTAGNDADALDRDIFLRTMLRELSGTLEEVVGIEQASGFFALTGQRIAERSLEMYDVQGDAQKLAEALCDFKRRIEGDFYIVDVTPDRIVLGNRTCPFGSMVANRPSLCMMTSNVFGTLAADAFGYARVDLKETIANGDKGCRVVIDLKRSAASASLSSREYFGE
ncbi:MAG: methanogen output domain 1-containing protein [bacterium]